MELPKDVQRDIVNFQALQNQLSLIQNQIARLSAEEATLKEAVSALESSEDEYAYRAVGPVLVREKRSVLISELKEKLEAIGIKKTSLEKKAKQIEVRLVELKKKIEAALANLQQVGGNAPQGG